ncbi:MAG: hypothetical protein PF447_11640 [Spirochaetaceae bacterium]|jgi:hypothetical protein|nr:hypothetical protein [Spirochaetaceae bacterium]
MKRLFSLISLTLTFFTPLILFGKGKMTTSYYHYYTPIYSTLEKIRNQYSIGETSVEIMQPGGMELVGSLLLITEKNRGIHILNIENPDTPDKRGFISIPGHFRMVRRGNQIIADSYKDLLIFEINDKGISLVEIKENVLSYNPVDLFYAMDNDNTNYEPPDLEKGLVIDWELTVSEYRGRLPHGAEQCIRLPAYSLLKEYPLRFDVFGDSFCTCSEGNLMIYNKQSQEGDSQVKEIEYNTIYEDYRLYRGGYYSWISADVRGYQLNIASWKDSDFNEIALNWSPRNIAEIHYNGKYIGLRDGMNWGQVYLFNPENLPIEKFYSEKESLKYHAENLGNNIQTVLTSQFFVYSEEQNRALYLINPSNGIMLDQISTGALYSLHIQDNTLLTIGTHSEEDDSSLYLQIYDITNDRFNQTSEGVLSSDWNNHDS